MENICFSRASLLLGTNPDERVWLRGGRIERWEWEKRKDQCERLISL
jgi:hypothetical protein